MYGAYEITKAEPARGPFRPHICESDGGLWKQMRHRSVAIWGSARYLDRLNASRIVLVGAIAAR